jgi:hypothetical protein
MPAAATREAKRSTSGCSPGISWITITAGPDPRRYTVRVQRPCGSVNSKRSNAARLVSSAASSNISASGGTGFAASTFS